MLCTRRKFAQLLSVVVGRHAADRNVSVILAKMRLCIFDGMFLTFPFEILKRFVLV